MKESLSASSTAIPPIDSTSPQFAPIVAAVIGWAAISMGFLGLKMLMEQRPEFVGQPLAFSKAILVQEAPKLVSRKVSEDVSVIRTIQPEEAEIKFNMQGRRDYRGLKTISDMSGQFSGQYLLTNSAEEPIFVLFRCPHPRAEGSENQSSPAGGFKLQASVPGTQENATNAWVWSGSVPAHSAATIEVSYQAASLEGVAYRVSQQNVMLGRLRILFDRRDLDSIHFESGDGSIADATPLVWKRENFLGPDFFSARIIEGRNLFTSLTQLVEIGPLISLLFLLSVTAIMISRQGLTAIQILTISAGYAFYFPLVIYLSSRFSFGLALTIAFVVPGLLLMNYARWLLGGGLRFMAAAVFLGLFQIFPTLAAFGGWNRGMVLLALGVITLGVLINLQNRALRRSAAVAAVFCLLAPIFALRGAEVQVILPAELTGQVVTQKLEKTSALMAFEPANYIVRQEPTHLKVEAKVKFRTIRPGETATPIFPGPLHLQESHIEAAESNVAQIVTLTNGLGLFVQSPGPATLTMSYRVPVENKDGKKRAQIPVLIVSAANVRIESPRSDLEFISGALWSRSPADSGTIYEAGAASGEALVLEWSEQAPASAAKTRPGAGEPGAGEAAGSYGIGLTRAQNLTVINSDGSCTHFTECELPTFQKEEFRLRLPANARLISVSINGNEIAAPVMEDQVCRVRLPERAPIATGYRLSFRLAYAPVRLGFAGSIELPLPEAFQTAGLLEWVVALPDGFETQVISSGLETQKVSPDLTSFGDYGRVLKSRQHTYLAKTLAPPAPVNLTLKYRQIIPGIADAR